MTGVIGSGILLFESFVTKEHKRRACTQDTLCVILPGSPLKGLPVVELRLYSSRVADSNIDGHVAAMLPCDVILIACEAAAVCHMLL